jgi:hypothetical protein
MGKGRLLKYDVRNLSLFWLYVKVKDTPDSLCAVYKEILESRLLVPAKINKTS